MSDMQRWDMHITHDDHGDYIERVVQHDGMYVTYADAVAESKAAYRQGYADGVRVTHELRDQYGLPTTRFAVVGEAVGPLSEDTPIEPGVPVKVREVK